MESEEREILGMKLITAAIKGDDYRLKQLVEFGADVNFQDEDGDTALMMAAEYGYYEYETETVKTLIELGADVNLVNKYGQTALMLEIQKGCLQSVILLVKCKADVNLKDIEGNTALAYNHNKHYEVSEYLKQHGAI